CAEAFIIGEKEKFVSRDWASQAGAELILAEWRLEGGAFRVEKIACVQNVIANEFESAAVVLVGSALRNHVHRGPGAAALFRCEKSGLNLEFQNVFHAGSNRDQRISAEIVIHSVDHEIVRHFTIS